MLGQALQERHPAGSTACWEEHYTGKYCLLGAVHGQVLLAAGRSSTQGQYCLLGEHDRGQYCLLRGAVHGAVLLAGVSITGGQYCLPGGAVQGGSTTCQEKQYRVPQRTCSCPRSTSTAFSSINRGECRNMASFCLLPLQ